jgi:hypothetical protein
MSLLQRNAKVTQFILKVKSYVFVFPELCQYLYGFSRKGQLHKMIKKTG